MEEDRLLYVENNNIHVITLLRQKIGYEYWFGHEFEGSDYWFFFLQNICKTRELKQIKMKVRCKSKRKGGPDSAVRGTKQKRVAHSATAAGACVSDDIRWTRHCLRLRVPLLACLEIIAVASMQVTWRWWLSASMTFSQMCK